MKQTITVINKYTKDTAAFVVEKTFSPRMNGLAMKKQLEECAYVLGCEVSDLEVKRRTKLK
jgi:hypothetical protein